MTNQAAQWEDLGSKGGVHEWRLAVSSQRGFGRARYVRVYLLEKDGAVQAKTLIGRVHRFPAGTTVENAKAWLEANEA